MFAILLVILLGATQANHQFAMSENETRLITSVNAYRAKHKLPPLEMDPTLMKVARQRVQCYSHCQNGKWVWTACHEAGFKGWATDDIARGYESPEDCVDGWISSDGHARQMRGQFNMNSRWVDYHFDRIGVARCGKNWIAIFGQGDK